MSTAAMATLSYLPTHPKPFFPSPSSSSSSSLPKPAIFLPTSISSSPSSIRRPLLPIPKASISNSTFGNEADKQDDDEFLEEEDEAAEEEGVEDAAEQFSEKSRYEASSEPELREPNLPEEYVYYDEEPDYFSLPQESEAEITAAYEALYGPAYDESKQLKARGTLLPPRFDAHGYLVEDDEPTERRPDDGFEEQLVQLRRVTKVVKGGKNMSFRAVLVIGDRKGHVGVGVGKALEVAEAVQKAAKNARLHIVTVPVTKHCSLPHRIDAKYGAAQVMLRPAAPGSGVIAGGAVRTVLEMAGYENALGKQLRSKNHLNNARATVKALQMLRTYKDVALARGIPMEQMWE